MADFLVVAGEQRSLVERARAGARRLGLGECSDQLVGDAIAVLSWPRRQAPGPRIVRNGEAWICAAGTWLHREGLGPGDEAALLDKLRDWGSLPVARELDGFFTIAWSDGHVVQIITDAIASHHAYTRRFEGAAAVAGSGLLLASMAPVEPDLIGCRELLTSGVVYQDRSLFEGIDKLGPAATFDLLPQGLDKPQRYWSCQAAQPESLELEPGIETFNHAVRESSRQLAAKFDRPVCDLTGGWDSRIVTGLLADGGLRFDTTVTGPQNSPDVRVSSRVADKMGWRHLVIEPGPTPDLDTIQQAFLLSDGEVNPIAYARIARVHRQLAQQYDISLNGSFGELARGYWWEILQPSPGSRGPLDGRRVSSLRYAAGAADIAGLWPDQKIDPVAHFANIVHTIDEELTEEPPRSFRLDHTYLRMRMRSWQGRIASTTDRIWPCLSPLMDRRAIETLLQIHSHDRLNNRFARHLLAQTCPELAAMPLETGEPALPLTAGNAWRFAPAAVPLAGKVMRKLLKVGGQRVAEQTAAPRLGLWRDERLRELLDPQRMQFARHCDPDALSALLERSRQTNFEHELLFGRLIGIEMALRAAAGR